jgi:hypothetical protein
MKAHTLTRPLVIGATLMLAATTTAAAQGQRLFQWSGRVDQEIQLTMNGRNLTASNVGRRETGQGQLSVTSALPRENGEVTVQLQEGRGTVDVIQQPTAANGFVAIIRIRDQQPGAATYRIRATWQAYATGDIARPYGAARGAAGRDAAARDAAARDAAARDAAARDAAARDAAARDAAARDAAARDAAAGRGYGRGRGAQNRAGTNRLALSWSGDVDDNLAISLRPAGVTYRTLSGKNPRGIQSSLGVIPQNVVQLTVVQTEGRGTVVVVQQPTAQNSYTAVLRVSDPQPGYGHYRFDVNWR